MKDWKGWLALVIFTVSCIFIGVNGLLLKKLNVTCICILCLSVVIVTLLKWPNKAKVTEETVEHAI